MRSDPQKNGRLEDMETKNGKSPSLHEFEEINQIIVDFKVPIPIGFIISETKIPYNSVMKVIEYFQKRNFVELVNGMVFKKPEFKGEIY